MSLLVLFGSGLGPPPAILPADIAFVEVQFTPGVWTNITADVVAARPITWTRGIPGHGPLDRVASTGLLSFTLRNDAGPGRLLGSYSPNHANARAGWTFGAPLRLSYRASQSVYPLWTGKVRTIRPTPGVHRAPMVEVTGQDAMGDLAEAMIRNLPAQINSSEGLLLAAIYNAVPQAAKPIQQTLDLSLDVYPLAFNDLGDGKSAMELINEVTMSAQGRSYVSAVGALVYKNRATLAQQTSRLTLPDTQIYGGEGAAFTAPTSLDTAYNRVRVTAHPKTFGLTNDIVLFSLQTPIWILAGTPTQLAGTYTDPVTQETVDGMNFEASSYYLDVDPVTGEPSVVHLVLTPYLHYEANSAVDGTGTDMTAGITVTVRASVSSVVFTVTNTANVNFIYLVASGAHVGAGGGPLGAPWLRLRGRPIYDRGPVTMESVAAAAYGDQSLAIDLPFQSDVNIAQGLADYTRTQFQGLRNRIDTITLNPQAVGQSACFGLEIGDVITISETMTGLTNVTAMIQAIGGQIPLWRQTGYPILTVQLTPTATNQLWILDDTLASVLGTTTLLGWA